MASYFLPLEDGGGYSLKEIAVVQKGVGMVAAVVGAVIGESSLGLILFPRQRQ